MEDLQNLSRGSRSELLEWLQSSSKAITSVTQRSLLSSIVGDD